ncbi:hypothetical protein BU24DRAFT_488505 [Aaosphaeria arxii CBS 175.79]|uniref:Telomere replication protein EST3 n=1 Tax=Aaosphaeria arxii CBS 175.79 TaxID=1450172 RepID=A0A6A5YB52_9PLEO|nr:uncharacterized protein BU24DRAFT_488505 [Aaosphaeria arxii CBS 175.79]KAF2022257.1 hypothetical protein BU24DRAFT_488505 [Aaosphaeria arxii CBS 175.79]
MEDVLEPWLVNDIPVELHQGRDWLQTRIERKLQGLPPEPQGVWSGLYADSGSFLDVTPLELEPGKHPRLQISQVSPLRLSDGKYFVEANVTPTCLQDLAARYPLLSSSSVLESQHILSIRKFSIRWSSWGPSDQALRLIVHAADLEPLSLHVIGAYELQPLVSNPIIVKVLEKLKETRETEERIFRTEEPDPDAEMGREKSNNERNIDVSSIGTQGSTTQNDTTYFGTQSVPFNNNTSLGTIGKPKGTEATAEKVQPSQHAQVPRSDSDRKTALLALLERNKKPPVGGQQSANPKDESRASIPDNKVEQPHGGQASLAKDTESLPNSNHQDPASKQKPDCDSTSGDDQIVDGNLDQPTVPSDAHFKPAWMVGWTFNATTTEVSREQAKLLAMPQTWHKPEPGSRYPVGNIPIEIYNEIAEQIAASDQGKETTEEDPTSDEADHDDDQGAQPDIDEDMEGSEAMVIDDDSDDDDESIDDMPSSAIPWSSSPPPPEAPPMPQMLQIRRPALPPDSSFEASIQTREAERINQKSIPPRTPSVPTPIDVLPPASSPPGVPPIESDNDEDMVLEVPQGLGEDTIQASGRLQPVIKTQDQGVPKESIPQATIQVKETPYSKAKTGTTTNEPSHTSSAPDHDSSGETKNTSSTSVVPGTYQEPSSSHENVSLIPAPGTEQAVDDENADDYMDIDEDLAMNEVPIHNNEADTISHIEVARSSPVIHSDERVSPDQPDTSKANAQDILSKRKLSESPTKSDFHKAKKRQKEIKVRLLDFKSRPPPTQELAESFDEDRKAATDRIRDDRIRHISAVTLPDANGSEQPEDSESVMQIDMESELNRTITTSVRNVENKQQAADPDYSPSASPRPYGHPIRSTPRTLHATGDSFVYNSPGGNIEEGSPIFFDPPGDSRAPSVPAAQKPSTPEPRRQVQLPTHPAKPTEGVSSLLTTMPSTQQQSSNAVYEAFKKAYPEYKADLKHFTKLCTEMYELEQRDQMVPKYQWDDYLIRHRTDYKKFMQQWIADDNDIEDIEPYHRFYKNTIEDVIYKKGVVKDVDTLERVVTPHKIDWDERIAISEYRTAGLPLPANITKELEKEDGVQSGNDAVYSPMARQDSLPRSEQLRVPMTSERSPRTRRSLPWTPSQPGTPSMYSSPSAGQKLQHGRASELRSNLRLQQPNVYSSPAARQEGHRSSSRGQPANVSLQDATASELLPEASSTGNAFRDFSFGFQRLTSFTGLMKATKDDHPHNVASRPSIEQKRNFNVLDWSHDRC